MFPADTPKPVGADNEVGAKFFAAFDTDGGAVEVEGEDFAAKEDVDAEALTFGKEDSVVVGSVAEKMSVY